eukprot:CAMPEP_0119559626 /NCGR_PEP_ID=MMETSP1352-20130426/12953_1 /TAXON_ID=265584 /ORGANISM="Stauroneis constricta, Strain CCMP1120" /LENGTH=444 /DNA_ID=CAMNT_0007607377 /DNA_START=59 /DNA_END=1393 /DNA_ORIENTATION=-
MPAARGILLLLALLNHHDASAAAHHPQRANVDEYFDAAKQSASFCTQHFIDVHGMVADGIVQNGSVLGMYHSAVLMQDAEECTATDKNDGNMMMAILFEAKVIDTTTTQQNQKRTEDTSSNDIKTSRNDVIDGNSMSMFTVRDEEADAREATHLPSKRVAIAAVHFDCGGAVKNVICPELECTTVPGVESRTGIQSEELRPCPEDMWCRSIDVASEGATVLSSYQSMTENSASESSSPSASSRRQCTPYANEGSMCRSSSNRADHDDVICDPGTSLVCVLDHHDGNGGIYTGICQQSNNNNAPASNTTKDDAESDSDDDRDGVMTNEWNTIIAASAVTSVGCLVVFLLCCRWSRRRSAALEDDVVKIPKCLEDSVFRTDEERRQRKRKYSTPASSPSSMSQLALERLQQLDKERVAIGKAPMMQSLSPSSSTDEEDEEGDFDFC